MSEMCPDCVFTYSTLKYWTTWNTSSQTPSVLTSRNYWTNYEELIATTGKNYFLGVKLNNNNEVTNAYACGVKDGTPFCIEGTSEESKYTENKTLLNGTSLWNNTCTEDTSDPSYPYTTCGPWDNSGSLSASASSFGFASSGVGDNDFCSVLPHGRFGCEGGML